MPPIYTGLKRFSKSASQKNIKGRQHNMAETAIVLECEICMFTYLSTPYACTGTIN